MNTKTTEPFYIEAILYKIMIEIKVHNLICSAEMNSIDDMNVLLNGLPGSEWNPRQFPGLTYRIGGSTLLIFKVGKVVSVGAESVEQAHHALDLFKDKLKELGINTEITNKVVSNVVCTSTFGESIILKDVTTQVQRSFYDPENFPGVIIRRVDPKCVILVFGSGSSVCVGCKSVEDARTAMNDLYIELTRLKLV